jgi:hypothetical protein
MFDKRRANRHATLTPCHVKAITSQIVVAPLRIINHSRGGIMLELDSSLAPGEFVDVFFSRDARHATGYMMSSCVGRVRWCRRQEGLYEGRFGVGLELSYSMLLRRWGG